MLRLLPLYRENYDPLSALPQRMFLFHFIHFGLHPSILVLKFRIPDDKPIITLSLPALRPSLSALRFLSHRTCTAHHVYIFCICYSGCRAVTHCYSCRTMPARQLQSSHEAALCQSRHQYAQQSWCDWTNSAYFPFQLTSISLTLLVFTQCSSPSCHSFVRHSIPRNFEQAVKWVRLQEITLQQELRPPRVLELIIPGTEELPIAVPVPDKDISGRCQGGFCTAKHGANRGLGAQLNAKCSGSLCKLCCQNQARDDPLRAPCALGPHRLRGTVSTQVCFSVWHLQSCELIRADLDTTRHSDCDSQPAIRG
jgi:hypothetical protein